MDFDYFYNREAERFNFLKVPEILVDGEEFKGLSAEAIILYSMLLKRTGMSFKNNWVDKEGRVFIYFTVEEIMRRRNISKPTAIKILDELDSKKGIGLIERVRLGLGKPNVIYVKGKVAKAEYSLSCIFLCWQYLFSSCKSLYWWRCDRQNLSRNIRT